jgi:hypothetical protein
MSKVLSINTSKLDNALQYKRGVDVPYFSPSNQLRNYSGRKGSNNEIQMLPNATLLQPRSIEKEEICGNGHDVDN